MTAGPVVRGGRIGRNWARIDGPGREAGVDLARGLAVVGMFAAHMVELPAFRWTDPTSWEGIANGRSSILFATLAGVSIALVTGGSRGLPPREATAARWRLVVRALCIWTLGVLLSATTVPIIVILPAYGILFLLAMPAVRWRPPALFAAAAVVGVAAPFAVHAINEAAFWNTAAGAAVDGALGWHYPFLLWAAFLALGMGLGRLRLREPATALMLLAAGVVLAAVGDGVIARWAAPAGWSAALDGAPHSSGVGEALGSGGFAMATIALCVLLCRTPLRWLAVPLRAVGAMPLSAYTAQFVVWFAVSVVGADPDPFAFRGSEPFWPFTIATLLACTAWVLFVGRGPLEWAFGRLASAAARDPRGQTGPHRRLEE
ncbi:heparan-alpha-glucosaminide N-acetyltransferase domain-containing protein [Microbacterium sp. Marseille-Q6965]|uniref:heparan-alpha-glucosaminide N-acetyltransferase domain-containing protein n=1 Tax=Microbacterium sp. Marseille-Q6965 TaxID=2965072 RepID=UPI0021B82D3C|nr:heparan-alpha-glucosaminide N-acetyltransferase domain-containing protein [Microbacterium sp. Marseille-Q6965]